MISDNLSNVTWRRSSWSQANGSCVELATDGRTWGAVQDSKQPGGGALVLGVGSFWAFVNTVRDGRVEA